MTETVQVFFWPTASFFLDTSNATRYVAVMKGYTRPELKTGRPGVRRRQAKRRLDMQVTKEMPQTMRQWMDTAQKRFNEIEGKARDRLKKRGT